MSNQPPERLMSADRRSGWYAFTPDGSRISEEDEPWEPPAEGSTIRLMGEHSVTVPLWSDDGLMFDEPMELVRALGVSHELAADLEEWANAWQTKSGQSVHDAEAAALVRRLKSELAYRYRVVYHP